MNTSETTIEPHLASRGLVREPFADTPDEKFFLLDSQRAEYLNTLYHLAQQGETPILITGCKGSGKTSLITKFLAMGGNNWRYCLVRANAMMNPEQLLRHVADGFGIEPDAINFDNAIEILRQRFIELYRSGLVAILIIDDAQDLPAASLTVLMKLSELQDDAHELLRILLFSEAQIAMVLASADLGDMRQRIRHTLEMPALNERQTIDYLQYRLGVAGSGESAPLSRGQMKQIYRQSKGIPLHINQAARAMLLDSGDAEATATRWRTLLIALATLGVIGLVGYFLAGDSLELTGPGDRETAVATLELPAPRTPVPSQTSPEKASLPAPAGDSQPAEATPAVDPATPAGTAEQSASTAEPSKNNEEIQDDTQQTAVAGAGNDWFTGLDPAHYTLQLIGSRNQSTLEGLRQQHRLGRQSAILTTQHQGGQWFVLVHGSYPDKDTARAAISTLPAALQQAKPWPRRIGELQTAP